MPSNMVDLSQPLFGDGTLLDESNEAKRRRIARVGIYICDCCARDVLDCTDVLLFRLAICVGKRKSSAMEKCPRVRIVLIIKRNVYSHKLRRRGIHQRGTPLYPVVVEYMLM